MPVMLDPPLALVMFPLASGVPTVGRTWMPDHVILDSVVPLASCALTLMVIEFVVTVPVGALNVTALFVPLTLVTTALTVAAGLKASPAGAFSTIAPMPMSRFAPSVNTGPINVV
jgi:hypothetical protein